MGVRLRIGSRDRSIANNVRRPPPVTRVELAIGLAGLTLGAGGYVLEYKAVEFLGLLIAAVGFGIVVARNVPD